MVLHIDKQYSEDLNEFVKDLMKNPSWKLGMFDRTELYGLMLSSYESPFQQPGDTSIPIGSGRLDRR